MLIFSETRVVPPMVNVVTLEDANGNYYYVHRDLYDQAVILSDLYHDNIMGFRLMISGAHVKECANTFFAEVPKPINILGYFLELIDNEEELSSLEEMCGAIHVMSLTLNFRNFLKIAMDLRKSVRFSLSIKEEYQLSYDRFFLEAMSYEDFNNRMTSSPYTANSSNVSYVSDDTDDVSVDAEGNAYDASWDDDIDWDSVEVEGAEDTSDASDTTYATEEAPIEDEVTEEAPKSQSGLDLIMGW